MKFCQIFWHLSSAMRRKHGGAAGSWNYGRKVLTVVPNSSLPVVIGQPRCHPSWLAGATYVVSVFSVFFPFFFPSSSGLLHIAAMTKTMTIIQNHFFQKSNRSRRYRSRRTVREIPLLPFQLPLLPFQFPFLPFQLPLLPFGLPFLTFQLPLRNDHCNK